MTDKQRLDWLIKVNAMIWNNRDNGKPGFTVCVPEMGDTGRHEVEADHKDLRKAIDLARKWVNESA
jgi:hypothetical protein